MRDEINKYLDSLVDKAEEYKPSDKAEELFTKLISQLSTVKGKKVYGYLPKNIKNTVDDIVREIAKDENISKLNAEWNRIKREKLSIYHDRETPGIPIVENKEFRSIKNAVISMAKYSNEVISSIGNILAIDIQRSCLKKYETLRGQCDGTEVRPIAPNLNSLLKAASKIAENPAEDEEERRKRIEAEENANNLGAVLGTVIGLASEVFSSNKPNDDSEHEEYEQEQYYYDYDQEDIICQNNEKIILKLLYGYLIF